MTATDSSVDLRTQLRELIASLPESELRPALRYLQFLEEEADPMLRRLRDAPLDDEELTPEEEAALDASIAEVAAGDTFSLDEIDSVSLDG